MSDEEKKRFDAHRLQCQEYDMDLMVGKQIDPARKLAVEREKKEWDKGLDDLRLLDAMPLFRNGFYQDKAIDNRILIASHYHFRQPLKTHAQAAAQAGAAREQAQSLQQPSKSSVPKLTVDMLVACMNNRFEDAKRLLETDAASINSADEHKLTPLMCAAESAAGRSTKDGIEETRPARERG